MQISNIKIRRLYSEGRLRALVSITVDEALAVHDIKVIEGPERTFVAMPSRREENGSYRDIVHPITAEARRAIEAAILDAYRRCRAAQETAPDAPPDPASIPPA